MGRMVDGNDPTMFLLLSVERAYQCVDKVYKEAMKKGSASAEELLSISLAFSQAALANTRVHELIFANPQLFETLELPDGASEAGDAS